MFLFCIKGTTNKTSVLQDKQEGGSVLHMTDTLRGRISPHPAWWFLKVQFSSFWHIIVDHQLKDPLRIT